MCCVLGMSEVAQAEDWHTADAGKNKEQDACYGVYIPFHTFGFSSVQ